MRRLEGVASTWEGQGRNPNPCFGSLILDSTALHGTIPSHLIAHFIRNTKLISGAISRNKFVPDLSNKCMQDLFSSEINAFWFSKKKIQRLLFFLRGKSMPFITLMIESNPKSTVHADWINLFLVPFVQINLNLSKINAFIIVKLSLSQKACPKLL